MATVQGSADTVASGPPALPPSAVVEDAARALRAGATHYTDRAGIPAVREQLARALGGAAALTADRLIITGGLQEGLFLALRALLAPGGTVACVGLSPELAGDVERLAQSLRLNPGAAAERADAVVFDGCAAASAALPGAGLAIVVEAPCAAPPRSSLLTTGLGDRALVIGDLTACGLGGWAVGYLAGPRALIDPMVELKQGLNICTAAAAQHALVSAAQRLPSDVRGRPSRRGGAPASTGAVRAPAPGTAPPGLADPGTRQRYELLDLLARTPDAITLGRGDPDLPTPPRIVEAAVAAMHRPPGAPDPRGLSGLRQAIAAKLAAENGVVVDPEREVLVTTGGQEAIFLLLQVLLGPGEEILMPSPRYTAYDVAVNVAGARIVDVPPPGRLDFRLDAAALERAITSRTRALLVISPGNPTAAVATRAELEDVAALARRRGLTLISDEIYERLVYDGAVHTSIAALPGMGARTVTVGGFSKAYAMTGWRIGYLAAPPEIVTAAARLKAAWSGPTSWIAQHGALAALRSGADAAAEMLETYAARRRLTLAALRAFGIEHAPAQGAFYVLFDIARFGVESYELSRRLLLEAGVFLYPGSGFGAQWNRHMRLAWLQPEDRLQQALERLGAWIEAQD